MNYYESKNFINCFNNHRKFIVENELIIPKEGLFEKSGVKLFNKKDIILHNDEIRPFYREITNNLIIFEKFDIKFQSRKFSLLSAKILKKIIISEFFICLKTFNKCCLSNFKNKFFK